MDEKFKRYLDEIFSSYEELQTVNDLKEELLADLQERFKDYRSQGYDDETAFRMTIDSIGNIEEIIESITGKTGEPDIERTVQAVADLSRSLERQVLTNFSASNLPGSDFAGVTVHKGKFKASMLRGSNFAGADLTGSSFMSSDVREVNFDGANLTDCNLSTLDLTGASFDRAILVRTNFSMSRLTGARFTGVRLTDVKLAMTDLKETIFAGCAFDGVDFVYSDLRGLRLDGQTFIGVKFDKAALIGASFKGATLKNVSFLSASALSKKYYRAIKTVCFDGATMDKLTYAVLKGMAVDLAKVIVS